MGYITHMAAFEKIIDVLDKEGYEINSDTKARVQQLLECIRDENAFHTLAEVQEWFQEQRKACAMQVTEMPITALEKWKVDAETGNIEHETGGFFSVVGVRVSNTVNREVVSGWTQPIIKQVKGILGILCRNFKGVRHYLINAKAEPGNIYKLQLSPTLQSTFSNLQRLHGGKKPPFAEYFEEVESSPEGKSDVKPEVRVLYSQWLAEDGGRFYLKVNKNMLVEVDEQTEITVPSDFIWLTMYQIKQLLKHDNLVGPHVRSIIAHL